MTQSPPTGDLVARAERWLPVPGYPSHEVSDAGRVRRAGVITKSRPNRQNYLIVSIWSNGKQYTPRIHRLVLSAFVGECPEGMQCAHLDGNRHNNALSNLQWTTAKENAAHRVAHGTVLHGEGHHQAKLTLEQVQSIRASHVPRSRTHGTVALARKYGVHYAAVSCILRGKTWNYDPPDDKARSALQVEESKG